MTRRRLAIPALFLLLLTLPETVGAESPRERQVRKIADILKALKFPVLVDGFEVKTKKRARSHDDLLRQQDLYFRPTHFEAMHILRDLVGLPAGADGADLKNRAVTSLRQVVHAYYQWDQKTLVFLTPGPDRGMVEADVVVAHELAHAYQDQTWDIEELLRAGHRTFENARINQCLTEGHAEFLALAYRHARDTGDHNLKWFEPRDSDDSLSRMLAGEMAILPYSAGRRFLIRRYKAGGLKALDALFIDRPTSTEQILHPEKKEDEPVSVPLPKGPWEGKKLPFFHEDVLGELVLYGLLLEKTNSREQARIGAAGWDGDALRIWKNGNGHRALVWRSVWDREQDAENFLAFFRPRKGTVKRMGRVIGWTYSTDPEEADRLAKALSNLPDLPAVPADAKTTAEVEKRIREEARKQSRVEEARWILEDYGCSLPIPDGWSEAEVRGKRVLRRKGNDPFFADNVSAISVASRGRDLDALAEDNRRTLIDSPRFELLELSKKRIAGRDLLWLDYRGQFQNGSLHFNALLFLHQENQIVITATVKETRWGEQKETVRNMLKGIRFGD